MAYHMALLSGKKRSKYNRVKKNYQSKQNKILEERKNKRSQ